MKLSLLTKKCFYVQVHRIKLFVRRFVVTIPNIINTSDWYIEVSFDFKAEVLVLQWYLYVDVDVMNN